MAKFIELTSEDGMKVLANVDLISRCGIHPDYNKTAVSIGEASYLIEESYEEVKKLLGVE